MSCLQDSLFLKVSSQFIVVFTDLSTCRFYWKWDLRLTWFSALKNHKKKFCLQIVPEVEVKIYLPADCTGSENYLGLTQFRKYFSVSRLCRKWKLAVRGGREVHPTAIQVRWGRRLRRCQRRGRLWVMHWHFHIFFLYYKLIY